MSITKRERVLNRRVRIKDARLKLLEGLLRQAHEELGSNWTDRTGDLINDIEDAFPDLRVP